jgi:uncharacterized protein YggE
LIALFANLPAPVEALADEAPRRTLSVTATGSIVIAPDQVAILSGVRAEGASPSEALAKNSAAMTRVIEALRGDGIASKDIRTTNLSVQPVYEQKDHPATPQVIGYRVNNSARVVLHDIAKLGPILDKVVSLGANDIGGIEFGLADPEAAKDAARKLAFANALAKAKLCAEAVGVGLGPILSVSEEETSSAHVRSATMETAKQVPIEAFGLAANAFQPHLLLISHSSIGCLP